MSFGESSRQVPSPSIFPDGTQNLQSRQFSRFSAGFRGFRFNIVEVAPFVTGAVQAKGGFVGPENVEAGRTPEFLERKSCAAQRFEWVL